METTGRIKGILRDWLTNKLIISLEIDSGSDELEKLSQEELDISIQKHRKKRSISANSYFHLLVSKIAHANGNGITEEKNRLIREHGEWEWIDGKIPTITVKAEYEDRMKNMEGVHLKVIRRDHDAGTVTFGLMRGSHTYNTQEMSILIDATVEEAKELGIETLTPMELKRMYEAWNTKS